MKIKDKTKLISWMILILTYFSFFGMVIINIPFTIAGIFLTNNPNYIISVSVAEISTAIYRMLEAILFTLIIRKITFVEIVNEKLNKKMFFGMLLAFFYSSVYYMIKSPTPIEYTAAHFIRTLIISPIFEEIMFRGAIQRTIKNIYNAKFAIIFTTIIFSIYHFDRTQSLFVVPLGFLFGYLAEKYSIKTAIFAHVAANTVSLIYYLNPKSINLFGIIGIITIIITLFLKQKNISEFFKEKIKKEYYKKAFINIPMILIILTFIVAIIGS